MCVWYVCMYVCILAIVFFIILCTQSKLIFFSLPINIYNNF